MWTSSGRACRRFLRFLEHVFGFDGQRRREFQGVETLAQLGRIEQAGTQQCGDSADVLPATIRRGAAHAAVQSCEGCGEQFGRGAVGGAEREDAVESGHGDKALAPASRKTVVGDTGVHEIGMKAGRRVVVAVAAEGFIERPPRGLVIWIEQKIGIERDFDAEVCRTDPESEMSSEEEPKMTMRRAASQRRTAERMDLNASRSIAGRRVPRG